ncbi:hypothetical protein EG832_22035, partial [bacterium]|nr:hypothetical protein [bacterium]
MSSVLPAIYNMTGRKGIRLGRKFARTFTLPWSVDDKSYEAAITNSKGESLVEFTVTRDLVNDKITLILTPTDLDDIPAGTYKYDIKQTDSLSDPINI